MHWKQLNKRMVIRVELSLSITLIDEVPKLTIWNNGPGMDEEELIRMTNLRRRP